MKKKWLFLLLVVFVLTLFPAVTVMADKIPWPTDTVHTYKGGFSLYSGHNGMDITAPSGSVLYAPFDGTAYYYQRYRIIGNQKVLVSYGNYVKIISSDGLTQVDICHMSQFTKVAMPTEGVINAIDYWPYHSDTFKEASWDSENDTEVLCGEPVSVKEGEIIGYSGGTGRSTGPHLHVTLYVNGNFARCVDPYNYFNPTLSALEDSRRKNNVTITSDIPLLYVGETNSFLFTVSDTLTTSDVKWKAEPAGVLQVNSRGDVKGLKAGTATVTAYVLNENGGILCSDSRTVTVKAPTITLNKSTLTLYGKENQKLTATVVGPSQTVTWSISSSLYMSVSKDGTIKADGTDLTRSVTATVTAKANGVSTKCVVTLQPAILKFVNNKIELKIGDKKTLSLQTRGMSGSIKYSTSNSAIATVNSKGLVTARKAGSVTITAKSASLSTRCIVTVKDAIKLNRTSVTIAKGESVTLTATTLSSNPKIIWRSSNASVATVNSSGKVTAKKNGTATITATANGVTAKCTVTVKAADYKSLYKAFLSKSSVTYEGTNTLKPGYFRVLDIDKNGVPELIVTVKGASPICSYYVFTIRYNTVRYIGECTMKGMGMTPYLRYDSKHQSLFVSGWINYVGGLWSSLYGIQNNKLVQQRFAVEYSDPTDGIYYKTGNTAASAKSVSKSQLASYTKSYMNDWKEYKMYENTSANRTKYIK